jgi:hypothetical protein
MQSRQKFGLVFLSGILGAVLVSKWWHSEIAARVGEKFARGSFHCLIVAGTGDCASLWWIGLHQENQIASLVFFGAIGLSIWALVKAKSLHDE